MNDYLNQVSQLNVKLDLLMRKQTLFSREIEDLRLEIQHIQDLSNKLPFEDKTIGVKILNEELKFEPEKQSLQAIAKTAEAPKKKTPKIKFDTEKFIGENLINKIGIAIMLIGLGIGTKYSIEHDLISPSTRIILSYLTGFGLLGLGLKLKAKYTNYSAVLVGGAMAVMYFVSYAAYSFYGLMPKTVAFILMLVFTGFTVFAALKYKQQVIALIGMVGAYAVPLMLSDGSGNAAVLFIYMTIINVGILFIAFKHYWKALYFTSYGLSWLIFIAWYSFSYIESEHFGLALLFSILFFLTFYSVFIAYKLLRKERFEKADLILLLSNTFIFYTVGFALLSHNKTTDQFLGLFTLCNAFIHAIISFIFYKKKQTDENLFYLVSGLSLIFISISIPVQLDGGWVTILWAGEAALLFWIGRTKHVPIYEKIAYPLMLLALFSQIHDWTTAYNPNSGIIPLINVNFLSSVLFISALAFINWLNMNKNYTIVLRLNSPIQKFISFSIPAIFIFSLYWAFRAEISVYFQHLYVDSKETMNNEGLKRMKTIYDTDWLKYKQLWIINYSLLFFSLLSFINTKKFKSQKLAYINMGINVFILIIFLSQGLYALSELRNTYLDQSLNAHYPGSGFSIAIRYISYTFVIVLLLITCKYIKQSFIKADLSLAFDVLLFVSLLWLLSSELINLMALAHASKSYKLALSILWGVYALAMVALGIWKQKKHLRLGAIVLFAITLLKLFFYDISHLGTLHKTIVFVSLGALLLSISFIYNKYTGLISSEISSVDSENK